MNLNKKLIDIKNRIDERSKDSRSSYLKKVTDNPALIQWSMENSFENSVADTVVANLGYILGYYLSFKMGNILGIIIAIILLITTTILSYFHIKKID